MKRCPSCNRTYTNDAQKFCTKDGTSLVATAPTGGLGETVRLDSSDLKTTQDDPEVTRVISREPSQPTGEFDPYKTIVSRPDTTADFSMTTGDLMPASIPPTPRPAHVPPPSPPSPPSPPAPSGPISSPSQPLQNPSGDIGQMTMASFAPPPPPPSSGQLSASLPPPPMSMPPPSQTPASAPMPSAVAAAPPKKKSKLPLILGILLVLFFLFVGVAGAAYWFVVKPMLDKRNEVTIDRTEPPREPTPQAANTPGETTPKVDKKEVAPYAPPADAVQFVNSKDRLDGKLAEHYVDFSFYYPQSWVKDKKAGVAGASNFAKVERRLPPDFTQENFAVGWYASAGSEEGDRAAFPGLAANLSAQFAKGFTEYKKVSEGPTKAGAYDGYEFRFESISRNTERGDIKIWGRVVFLPPVDGGKNGVTLLMLATSLAQELKSVDDVGIKGDLPMMLESFRFGK